jgi:tRNA pseudouridine55 synthase
MIYLVYNKIIMSIIIKQKNVSETPGEMANQIKQRFNLNKISYCGKLDPMSRGVMLFLTDGYCKKQEQFLKLDKIYEFEILFGFKTDSYDILGIIDKMKIENDLDIESIINYTESLTGKHQQYFPPFSSITAMNDEGLRKPLWWWSKYNRINEIRIPHKEINIYSMDFISSEKKTFQDVIFTIKNKINSLKGDFRQKEILELWEQKYKENQNQSFHVLKFRTEVSSGTYIRSIIQKIATNYNTYGIAYDINRTKLGVYY